MRHALAAILRESDIADPRLAGVSVTVTEVRVSPDLRHATCFVEPLGAGVGGPGLAGLGGDQAQVVVDGLNHAARFLRGQLGRAIELKFTPDLHFVHDPSFEEAARMNALFNRPEVRRDLEALLEGGGSGGGVGTTSGVNQGDVSQAPSASAAHTPIPDPSPLADGEGRG